MQVFDYYLKPAKMPWNCFFGSGLSGSGIVSI